MVAFKFNKDHNCEQCDRSMARIEAASKDMQDACTDLSEHETALVLLAATQGYLNKYLQPTHNSIALMEQMASLTDVVVDNIILANHQEPL